MIFGLNRAQLDYFEKVLEETGLKVGGASYELTENGKIRLNIGFDFAGATINFARIGQMLKKELDLDEICSGGIIIA